MSSSPAGVLRSIAHRIGCSYDDIERAVNEEMGGEPIEWTHDAGRRLERIRRKLMTPEAGCVVEQTGRMFRKTT